VFLPEISQGVIKKYAAEIPVSIVSRPSEANKLLLLGASNSMTTVP